MNPQTARDNAFQHGTGRDLAPLAADAFEVSTRLAEALVAVGVTVHLFEDTERDRPDSVFCNNWFTAHHDGRIVVYPMYAPNRRRERRGDVVEALRRQYAVTEVVDLSHLEREGFVLEGTGAMVFDHIARVAFAARSHRADPRLFEHVCGELGYEPVMFDATDERGTPIYHTNVMMNVGTEIAMVCLDTIASARDRAAVVDRLLSTGRAVVELERWQLGEFAANAIELSGLAGRRILVLSTRAQASLTPAQREVIEGSVEVVGVDATAVEHAGGSVRCMIAGIHLAALPLADAEATRRAGRTGSSRRRH